METDPFADLYWDIAATVLDVAPWILERLNDLLAWLGGENG